VDENAFPTPLIDEREGDHCLLGRLLWREFHDGSGSQASRPVLRSGSGCRICVEFLPCRRG
jgi:hypothetical protein